MIAPLTIEDLPAAYRAAREAASASARYTPGDAPPATCRYCGGARWCGSDTRDGHARCIVTAEFRASVARLWWSTPTLTRESIAAVCSVPVHTVKSWTDRRRTEVARCV